MLPLAPFLDYVGLFARSAVDLAMAAPVLTTEVPPVTTIQSVVVFKDVLENAEPSVMQSETAGIHANHFDHPISPVLRRRLAKGLQIDDAALTASRAVRPQLVKDFEDKILGKADAARWRGSEVESTIDGFVYKNG